VVILPGAVDTALIDQVNRDIASIPADN